MDPPDDSAIAALLRSSGARFAFRFGSTTTGASTGASDVDVGAWWGDDSPEPWDVEVPDSVDLVVLDRAPIWLAGRVAMDGVLILDDDPAARVAWQADTRLRYLDERPLILESQREWRRAVLRG